MSDISRLLGQLTSGLHRIEVGATAAGIHHTELDNITSGFLSGMHSFLQDAAYEYTLEWMRGSARLFDLGEGFIFAVGRRVDLRIDYGVDLALIEDRSGRDGSRRYASECQVPAAAESVATLLIGRFLESKTTSERGIKKMLSKPGCPVTGSGAWVREAFMAAFNPPAYRCGVAFPDPATSRWEYPNDVGRVDFSILDGDASAAHHGRKFFRNDDHLPATTEICFLLKPTETA